MPNLPLDILKKYDTTFSAKVIVGKEQRVTDFHRTDELHLAFRPILEYPSSNMQMKYTAFPKRTKSYLIRKEYGQNI